MDLPEGPGLRRRELLAGALASIAACGPRSDGAAPAPSPSPSPTPGPGVPASPPGASRLRVLTYNVLADRVALPLRMPPLLALLAAADADALLLQEVAPWFLGFLRRAEGLRGYTVATLDGAPARPNGQMILARRPLTRARAVDLPGPQGRALLIAELTIADDDPAPIVLATTHMESPLEAGAIRAEQLQRIFAELRDVPAEATTIFAGDLNFGDGEAPETAALDPDFVDLWTALRPAEPGFTWDIERSEMARAGSFPGEPSRRLDRVLVRSRRWAPASIEIVGDRPVRDGDRGLFPSDHFGLVGELRRPG